ncbi:phage tail tape measure protein [Neisseria musculi]|uniref:Phage tail tape measure protein TP901 family core region n=1 Tax=Neisseria musculi TaxID=1815583 RepID=A0A7H1M932_9NEIS|nr:phage tail tape measure protein [Neisseria musculi]QNT58147.1 phage tail tape measure protein, TP901 family, core region [Neisseria musculi]
MSSNLAIAITVGASVGSALAGLRRLNAAIVTVRSDALSTGQKLKSLGSTTLIGVTGAVTGIKAATGVVMGLAEEAVKFESAMADVKKVVDFESPEGLKNLQKDILQMTRTIPMAKEELAKIAASGGQLGVAEKDLKSFTATIAKMGVAFDMPAEQAGDSMAKLANVYQIPIEQIGKLGDAVNHLSNSSPAKASNIVNALGRVGGVAKQFGLTELQTASLSNAFISLGKTPEVAGTAINGMLTKLMTADKQGKKFQAALEGMGTDAKALKKAIAENGEQALVDFLKQIEKLPKESQMGALVDLFGLEYADDVAVLAGSVETYEKSIKALQKAGKDGMPEFTGSMEKEFAARSATTENGLTLMKNGFAELKTVVGDRLLPVINKVSAFIGNLTHNLTDFATKNPEVVDGLLLFGGVIAGLIIGFSAFTAVIGGFSMGWVVAARAVSPIISVLGAVLKAMSFFGRGIMQVIRFLPMLGSAFLKLGAFLMANPIFLALGLLAAAAYLLYRNWDSVVGGAKALWQGLGSFFSGLWASVSAAFQTAWSGMTARFGTVWEGIKAFAQAGIAALLNLILTFSPVTAFITAFQAVWAWLSGLGAAFMRYGSMMIDGLVNGIKAGIGRAVEAVQGVVSAVKSAFTSDRKGMAIHSPSRVFAGYGGFMTEGLAIGINRGAARPLAAVGNAAGRLKDGFTRCAGSLRADLAARISGGSAEFAAARAAQPQAAGGITVNFNPTIHAPGGNPAQIQTALQMGLREFETMFKRMMADRERRAY